MLYIYIHMLYIYVYIVVIVICVYRHLTYNICLYIYYVWWIIWLFRYCKTATSVSFAVMYCNWWLRFQSVSTTFQLPPLFTKALRKASACSRYPLSLISCKQLFQKYQGGSPWGFMDTKTTTIKHDEIPPAALQSYRYRQLLQILRTPPSPGISARTLGWGQ